MYKFIQNITTALSALLLCSSIGVGMVVNAAPSNQLTVSLSDPTRPKHFSVNKLITAAKTGIEPIKITAIFTSPKQHYAVIDGASLSTGDKVRDYIIHSIDSQHVILARNQSGKIELTTLSVFEEEVKSYAKQ